MSVPLFLVNVGVVDLREVVVFITAGERELHVDAVEGVRDMFR